MKLMKLVVSLLLLSCLAAAGAVGRKISDYTETLSPQDAWLYEIAVPGVTNYKVTFGTIVTGVVARVPASIGGASNAVENLNGKATNMTLYGSSTNVGTLYSSNVADRCNARWWGASGINYSDDTVSLQNAVNYVASFGGTLYIPSGKYRSTAPITITNSCSIVGDYPNIKYATNDVADQLILPANGGTWINFSGTNGFVGYGLRGVNIENLGITNFYKMISFGSDGVEGATFSSIRNVVGLGNPTVNTSEIGVENYNFMFFKIDSVKVYAVNTGLRLVCQNDFVPPGNSVIEDFYVFTYPKSVANANTNKPGIAVLHINSTRGPCAGPFGVITFIRPQCNSFNGDGTGIGILLQGDTNATSYIHGLNLLDSDVEGPLRYSIYMDRVFFSKISIKSTSATPGYVLLSTNAGYGNTIESQHNTTTISNLNSGRNTFYGYFDLNSTTNAMKGVYETTYNNRLKVVADDITGRMLSDSGGFLSPNVDGTGTASYHPGGIYVVGSVTYLNSTTTTISGDLAGTSWLLDNSGVSFINGGNVGIGTFTPSSPLDVTGQVRAASAIITNMVGTGDHVAVNAYGLLMRTNITGGSLSSTNADIYISLEVFGNHLVSSNLWVTGTISGASLSVVDFYANNLILTNALGSNQVRLGHQDLTNYSYNPFVISGVGGANTNFTLQAGQPEVIINAFTNVSIRGVMGGSATKIDYIRVTMTNGSGTDRTLEFSPATNSFRFAGVYGTNAPSVVTNLTQLHATFRVSGVNVLVNYDYYPWP